MLRSVKAVVQAHGYLSCCHSCPSVSLKLVHNLQMLKLESKKSRLGEVIEWEKIHQHWLPSLPLPRSPARVRKVWLRWSMALGSFRNHWVLLAVPNLRWNRKIDLFRFIEATTSRKSKEKKFLLQSSKNNNVLQRIHFLLVLKEHLSYTFWFGTHDNFGKIAGAVSFWPQGQEKRMLLSCEMHCGTYTVQYSHFIQFLKAEGS